MLSGLTVLAVLVLMLSGPTSAAEQRQGRAATQKVPTTITSSRMDYNANNQTVIFLGNVYVKRPDFELWSEKMTVYLDKSEKSKEGSPQAAEGMEAGDIDRIVAEKNVRLKSENNSGTCDKATYYAKEDKFVMEGRPVLRDTKQSTVSGRTIVHYLSTNRSQVHGGTSGGGATATFYSEDRTEGGGVAPGPVLPGVGGSKKNTNGSGKK